MPDTELTTSQEPDAHSPACKCSDHGWVDDTHDPECTEEDRRGTFCSGCGISFAAGESHRWPCHPDSTLRPAEPKPVRLNCPHCGAKMPTAGPIVSHYDMRPGMGCLCAASPDPDEPKPEEPHPTGCHIGIEEGAIGWLAHCIKPWGTETAGFNTLPEALEFAKRYLGG